MITTLAMEPMKSILIPLEDEGAQAQLETALLAAQAFRSHMDGVAPRAAVDATFYGEGLPLNLQDWEREDQARVERTQRSYRAFIDASRVPWGEPSEPSDQPSAGWIVDIERGSAMGELARLYDMTVLAHPATTRRHDLLETILFESGRPIVLSPAQAPKSLGKTVVIAWNGSTESARTVAFARPFLLRAEQVHVLSVEGGMVAGPNATQVQSSLRRAGIAARTLVVGQEGRSTGEAILQETAKLGGDLLVKGAYTQSRLRQMIFGGATSYILKEAKVPVFMTH